MFTNIIASHFKSKSEKKIVIAAHYDSKLFNSFTFLGATDSAVSCSILIDLSRFINENIMSGNWTKLEYNFQLVFFDGEEAFQSWSSTDSLYGSRNLASVWLQQNKLKDINLFILLDLIGMKFMTFKNHLVHYDTGTSELYSKMVQLELNIRRNHQMKTSHNVFDPTDLKFPIEDDHVPFESKGVPILHLITCKIHHL
jgi:glutaminyl-peptide cyclotransferase